MKRQESRRQSRKSRRRADEAAGIRRRSRSPQFNKSAKYLKSRAFGSPHHQKLIERYSKRLDELGD